MKRTVWSVGAAGFVWAACMLLVLPTGAQATPGSSSGDAWKQPPEGRAAAASPPINCSGSISMGDGKATPVSDCAPSPAPSPLSPSLAKRFPYPGESADKDAASPRPATQGAQSTTDAPPAGQTGAAAPAGKRFPYPGEAAGSPNGGAENSSSSSAGSGATAAPGSPGTGSGLQDAGSSGESSSSTASSASSSSSNAGGGASPDDPALPFTDSDTVPAPKRGRKKLPPVARQSPSEREEEDVKIAGFYLNDGNYKAAYSRAQDAVGLTEDDAEAHLMLAEAARKLGKLDEAQTHYRRCLALDPVPKLRKTAERALKEMSGGS